MACCAPCRRVGQLHGSTHWVMSRGIPAWRSIERPETSSALPVGVTWLQFAGGADAHADAGALYRRLREADHRGLQTLVLMMPPDAGLGDAMHERRQRAAGRGDCDDDLPPPQHPSENDA